MKSMPEKRRIGWREWIRLPELGIGRIKVKIDTGARSSCLHAMETEFFEKSGEKWVRFKVAPRQKDLKKIIEVESKLLEIRNVKSSNGLVSQRPVIVTTMELMGQRHEIELTLANRKTMGFRMLLGREAIRGCFLVDSGVSYLGGKPKKKGKKKRETSVKTNKNTDLKKNAKSDIRINSEMQEKEGKRK